MLFGIMPESHWVSSSTCLEKYNRRINQMCTRYGTRRKGRQIVLIQIEDQKKRLRRRSNLMYQLTDSLGVASEPVAVTVFCRLVNNGFFPQRECNKPHKIAEIAPQPLDYLSQFYYVEVTSSMSTRSRQGGHGRWWFQRQLPFNTDSEHRLVDRNTSQDRQRNQNLHRPVARTDWPKTFDKLCKIFFLNCD